MGNLILRFFINAFAVWVAAHVVQGFYVTGGFWGLLVVAAVFGIVNALIRPIVILLSLPAVVLTLGIITLFINGMMVWLTSAFTHHLVVWGFWSAFWGALVISLVSWVLSHLLKEKRR